MLAPDGAVSVFAVPVRAAAVPARAAAVPVGAGVATDLVGAGAVLGAGAVAAGGAAAAVVIVVVRTTVGVPDSPAILIRAAARTASDSRATSATVADGPVQFGEAARRVRAGAPQRRHQSWSGSSAPPQSGQAALTAGAATARAVDGASGTGGEETLTSPRPAAG